MTIRSLSMGRKLALLGLVCALLFVVPFYFYARQALEVVATSRQEQAGIAPARSLLRLIQLTQQHRGLFNGGMADPRAAKQVEVDKQVAELSASLAASPRAAVLGADFSRIATDWEGLTQAIASGSLQRPESFRRHSELITRQLDLVARVTEVYGIAYDGDADAHHLVTATLVHLPKLTEAMGRARARGAAYLVAQQLDPQEQATISGLAQTARSLQRETTMALQKAMEARASLDAPLAALHQAAVREGDKALGVIDAEILRATAPTLAAPAYFQVLTQAIDAQFVLLEKAAVELDALLAQRALRQQQEFGATLAVLALLLLVVTGAGYAIARSITRPLQQAVLVARQVAAGDLRVEVPSGGRDEVGQLLVALAEMTQNLRKLVGEVAQGAHLVADTSAQIAQGNVDLSQRTEEQASTLEETASSMEELTSTVSQNAENARQASNLAVGASEVARKGGQVVGQVVSTMTGISESSRKIADIIGVIDGIAFQTNILALNAAVEAARAGEQGRGFAVVAAEVRNLAQRSASAAKEIKTLIGESVDKVDAGARLVEAAGLTMEEIVGSVKTVSDLIAEIAAASNEQSSGIEQVNTAVTQMDQVVQQNASLVEEAAAATEAMKAQSAGLLQMVARFKLGDEHALPASPPAIFAAAPAPAARVVEPIRFKPAAKPLTPLPPAAPRAPAGGEWTEF